ncbi:DUF2804 domain-containing protein [Pseudactinotalea sp. Z1748]|uniref:DUF2804 domain-containing protein n=1 Tax=Pseudactinotalea sp. Z1748 TaxID=3413027 RepID=UPI003C7AEDC7
MLPEIVRPVDLCLPSGALNPAALGWSRRALHRANLRTVPLSSRAATWSRTKRREHWGINTPDHLIALTVNSLNYAAAHQVWILDRSDGTVIEESAIVPLARHVELPETAFGGPVRALTRDLAIAVDTEDGNTRLRAKTPRVRLDLHVPIPPESLGVVIPWSDRQFQYTLKSSALPVSGRLEIDDADTTVGPDAWANVDHGRGRWPYSTIYTSAVASGAVAGVRTGLHLGGLWTEGTGSTENALIIDSRVHYLPEETVWTFDADSPTGTWMIEGDRVEATLEPFHHGSVSTNLGIVATTTTGVCGTWHGWAADDDGGRHRLDGLVGWAEFTSNRW